MNTNVNPGQAARVEAARRCNGQFGTQPRGESDLDLSSLLPDTPATSATDDRGYVGGARPPAETVREVLADGTQQWKRNGRLHRDFGPAVERPDGTKEWWVDGRKTLGDPLDADNKFDPRFDREGHTWAWSETSQSWRLMSSIVGVVESPGLNNIDHLHGPLRLPFEGERVRRRFRRPETT